ncbi:MAG: type II toxin-antitoxin system death-on-curing family toxin [Candidatus Paceibacterota bacterium]
MIKENQSPNFRYLDKAILREVCHRLAKEVFGTSEPMPPFDDHNTASLESALVAPSQSIGGSDLYPSIEEKAAVLFYGLVKNHPFGNGNKRMAAASLVLFLYLNDYLFEVSREDFRDKTIEVAKSSGDYKAFIEKLSDWISGRIKSF